MSPGRGGVGRRAPELRCAGRPRGIGRRARRPWRSTHAPPASRGPRCGRCDPFSRRLAQKAERVAHRHIRRGSTMVATWANVRRAQTASDPRIAAKTPVTNHRGMRCVKGRRARDGSLYLLDGTRALCHPWLSSVCVRREGASAQTPGVSGRRAAADPSRACAVVALPAHATAEPRARQRREGDRLPRDRPSARPTRIAAAAAAAGPGRASPGRAGGGVG